MLLFPKKPKFLKSFSGKKIFSNSINKKSIIKFANLCLVSKNASIITNFQLESIRLFLRRYLKKRGQIFFRVFPNRPITKKPDEIRLGRGKGQLKYWAYFLKKGDIIVEIRSFNNNLAYYHLKRLQIRLALKSFIHNRHSRWIL